MGALGIEQFEWAARQLGLKLAETPSSLQFGRILLEGTIEGQPVSIRQWRGDFVWVELDARFEPEADLHLSIEQAGVGAKLAALFGMHDIEVGDPAFDRAFVIAGHEPERVRGLLTPEVCAALMPWKDAGDLFSIDDEGVHVSVRPGSYSTLDGETIVKYARAAAALARTFSTALSSTPPSKVLAEHVEAWGSHARQHGLGFSASPLRMWGTSAHADYRDAHATSFVARVAPVAKDAYGVEVRARLAERLPFHLRIRPAHWYAFFQRTTEAIRVETDDATFDDLLRVTTGDPDRARGLLGDAARAALSSMQRDLGDVSLENDVLSLRTREMIEPARIAQLAEVVSEAARTLMLA